MSDPFEDLWADEAAAPEQPAPAAAAADMPAAGAGTAQPFTFDQVAAQHSVRLAGIDRLGERMARQLRAAIEPIARVKTQVAAASVGPVQYGAWLRDLPEFMSLSHFRMGPLKGGVLVAIDAGLVIRLVDAFYGGSGKVQRERAREFTPTEERLLGRVTAAVADALVAAWSEVAEFEPVLLAHEINPAFMSFVRADEQVVLQTFTVTPGAGPPAKVTAVYTSAGLRPLEPQLAAKVPGGLGEPDPEWRAKLVHALESVRLPVRTVLARPEMRMSELMALKPGDVIPVTLPARAPLIVADQHLATGTLGDREGKAALMIEQVFGAGA